MPIKWDYLNRLKDCISDNDWREKNQIENFTFKTFYCKGGFLKNVT